MSTLLINKKLNLKTDPKTGITTNRVWLEGKKLARHVAIGAGMKITDSEDGNGIDITFVEAGKGDRTVSKRRSGTIEAPLIEISESNSKNLKNMDPNSTIRVVVKDTGIRITVNKDTLEHKIMERENYILDALKTKTPLEAGSVFCGGGTLDHAGHKGFKAAGLATVVRFAIDNDPEAIDNMSANVGHVFDNRSILIESDISLLNVGNGALPKLHILKITPPCVDASPAGKAKKGNKFETSKTAHLIYHYSQIIERTNPAYVIVENVPNFQNEVSFHLLTALLDSWGYNMQLRVIDAHEEGFSLETRKRMFLVAESRGLNSDFDLEAVKPVRECHKRLGDVLDYVEPDAKCWSPKTGLILKQERDKAAGKGFMMQTYDENSTKIGTLRAQIQKSGSTDPLIIHPNEPLFRIPNKDEHARIKEIDESFVANTTQGQGHKFLGNGLSGLVAESICFELGRSIKKLIADENLTINHKEALAA